MGGVIRVTALKVAGLPMRPDSIVALAWTYGGSNRLLKPIDADAGVADRFDRPDRLVDADGERLLTDAFLPGVRTRIQPRAVGGKRRSDHNSIHPMILDQLATIGVRAHTAEILCESLRSNGVRIGDGDDLDASHVPRHVAGVETPHRTGADDVNTRGSIRSMSIRQALRAPT